MIQGYEDYFKMKEEIMGSSNTEKAQEMNMKNENGNENVDWNNIPWQTSNGAVPAQGNTNMQDNRKAADDVRPNVPADNMPTEMGTPSNNMPMGTKTPSNSMPMEMGMPANNMPAQMRREASDGRYEEDMEENPVFDPNNTRIPTERERRRTERPSCFTCRGEVYVVKKGDTLYKIAKEHGLKVIDLLVANPYVNVYNMQVGEEICIPAKAVAICNQGRLPRQ